MKNKPIPQGKLIEGDITPALDSRFLNATVLSGSLAKRGASELTVTIDRVEYHESLKYQNGQIDKEVYLLFFAGSDKPLKLAKTNIKRLIVTHGPIVEKWHGQKITLVIEQDKRPDLGGAKGDCVRIKSERNATVRTEPLNPFAASVPAIETEAIEEPLE